MHVICRRDYTDKRRIHLHLKETKENKKCPTPATLRSSKPIFIIEKHCLFRGVSAKYDGRKGGFDVIPVRTKSFDEHIVDACETRQDEWADIVCGRINSVHDLNAAGAVYHKSCSIHFRTGRQVPSLFLSDDSTTCKRKCGRPLDDLRNEVFCNIVKYLKENDDEQTTIVDLIDVMKVKLNEIPSVNLEPYSFPYMKKKLIEHFGDDIIIPNINGKKML